MQWLSDFYYDETSPSCLRWARDVSTGRGGRNVRFPAGSVAGSIGGKRYWHVMLNWKDYKVHRIIWEIANGSLGEGDVIDHIDGNSKNNRLDNLRKTDMKVNSMNRKKGSNNTSGKTGVSCTSNGEGTYYWTAFWKDMNMKHKSKCFSISKLGLLPAFTLACQYREAAIEELNKQGAAYTERHGE